MRKMSEAVMGIVARQSIAQAMSPQPSRPQRPAPKAAVINVVRGNQEAEVPIATVDPPHHIGAAAIHTDTNQPQIETEPSEDVRKLRRQIDKLKRKIDDDTSDSSSSEDGSSTSTRSSEDATSTTTTRSNIRRAGFRDLKTYSHPSAGQR